MSEIICPRCRKAHTPVTVLGGKTAADLVKIIQDLENSQTEPQYTIFRFGSHWKVACSIPDLSQHGRRSIENLIPSTTLVDALRIAVDTKNL